MPLVKPAGYRNLLDNVENTEKAIKLVKDMFQQNLSAQLALLRVTAPMVVLSGTGINDDLNSVERPVSFPIRDMGERRAEVVHSLAKWKRLKLAEMVVAPGRGIYTDMNALRSSTTFTRFTSTSGTGKRSLRASSAPSLS